MQSEKDDMLLMTRGLWQILMSQSCLNAPRKGNQIEEKETLYSGTVEKVVIDFILKFLI